jgi:hypothetical protein
MPIGGIMKEKQLHFLDLTEHLVGLKNQTSPSPTKCRPRSNEGTKGSKATAPKRRAEERSENHSQEAQPGITLKQKSWRHIN